MSEHRHTDDCYGEIDGRLICPRPEARRLLERRYEYWQRPDADPLTVEPEPVRRPMRPGVRDGAGCFVPMVFLSILCVLAIVAVLALAPSTELPR